MTETKAELARQYSAAYGPFAAGEHQIGQRARAHSTSGEIVWSFRKDGQGPVTYVLDDGSGWPVEVEAASIIEVVQ